MKVLQLLKKILQLLATERVLAISMLIISVALNVFLAYQLRQARGEVTLYRENRKLTIGETAPVLSARDRNGNDVALDFVVDHVPTVLYLESTTCHWCQQNRANLEQLAAQSVGRYRLVRLVLEKADHLEPEIPENQNIRVLFQPTVESRLTMDLTSTPTTVFISSDGKITKIWKGAYNQERKIDIEDVLGIKLPGIKEESRS